MRAVARRADARASAIMDTLRCGALELDEAGHVVREDGVALDLTLTEFKRLAALMRHPGRAFTRLQLLQAATGDYFEEYERTVDSHISHVRRKPAHPDVIQSVPSDSTEAVTSTWPPAGVTRRALAARLANAWRSRPPSPRIGTRVAGVRQVNTTWWIRASGWTRASTPSCNASMRPRSSVKGAATQGPGRQRSLGAPAPRSPTAPRAD